MLGGLCFCGAKKTMPEGTVSRRTRWAVGPGRRTRGSAWAQPLAAFFSFFFSCFSFVVSFGLLLLAGFS